MQLAADVGKGCDVLYIAAAQQQTTMVVPATAAAVIQQLQMQLYGLTSPWNVGVAYRIPDTKFNRRAATNRDVPTVSCLACLLACFEYSPTCAPTDLPIVMHQVILASRFVASRTSESII